MLGNTHPHEPCACIVRKHPSCALAHHYCAVSSLNQSNLYTCHSTLSKYECLIGGPTCSAGIFMHVTADCVTWHMVAAPSRSGFRAPINGFRAASRDFGLLLILSLISL